MSLDYKLVPVQCREYEYVRLPLVSGLALDSIHQNHLGQLEFYFQLGVIGD